MIVIENIKDNFKSTLKELSEYLKCKSFKIEIDYNLDMDSISIKKVEKKIIKL